MIVLYRKRLPRRQSNINWPQGVSCSSLEKE